MAYTLDEVMDLYGKSCTPPAFGGPQGVTKEQERTFEEVDDYMSGLDEEDLERFCDEMGVPRKYDILDLIDFRFPEWPEELHRKGFEWLVKEGLFSVEELVWLG